jgi:hypothetical protein
MKDLTPRPDPASVRVRVYRGHPALTIEFDKAFLKIAKGLKIKVYRVSKFVVHKEFEGEEVEFPMNEHDLASSKSE